MNTFTNADTESHDAVARKLKTAANTTLVIAFGLLPLFFIPLPAAPFGYSKVLFVLVGLAVALVLYSLYTLRVGHISLKFPYALAALWAVFGILLLSALLSGDFKDAFVGNTLSIHSVGFVGILALIATAWMLFSTEKTTIMRMYFLLAVSTVVLAVFHALRLVFGESTLSFGVFTSNVSTPLGGWNDLALFFGLAILLSLVALEQLSLTKWGKWFIGVVTFIALGMLAVINFIYVWLVLAIISLVMLIYTIRRPQKNAEEGTSASSLMLSILVFAVSVVFLIGGSAIGGFVNDLTGISFVEVRPSIQSTTGIALEVYSENAFLGVGPNKFIDAWRMYKNPAINTSIFWNTDFNAGSGYIPTFFVTGGVLGGVAWVAFLALFVFMGLKMLLRNARSDHMWYFIGISAFVSAVYIWGMSLVYVPGPAVLMLGALCTGIAFLAYNKLSDTHVRTFAINDDRRTGFIFTLVVILIIIGSISVLYTAGRHYAAAYAFNDSIISIQDGVSLDEIEAKIVRAFELSENDLYVRRLAEYQLARMNSLITIQSPSEVQQQQFDQALANGLNAGQLATESDNTEPSNWAILGEIYSLLVSANVEGSYERAQEALERARSLDPRNPSRYLALANLEARAGNFAEARSLAEAAIERKSNYSDAFFFLTQLAVTTGNVDEAVQSARTVISLEPQNPARYYQLGVLESSRGNLAEAVAAFERALELDPNYANAMYFLALAYDAQGNPEEARPLLERVRELNPGNENVTALINELDATGSLGVELPNTLPVTDEAVSVSEEDGVVTTDEELDTELITPVNVSPESEDAAETEDGAPEADANAEAEESTTIEAADDTDVGDDGQTSEPSASE